MQLLEPMTTADIDHDLGEAISVKIYWVGMVDIRLRFPPSTP